MICIVLVKMSEMYELNTLWDGLSGWSDEVTNSWLLCIGKLTRAEERLRNDNSGPEV